MSFKTDCSQFINKYSTFNQSPGELEQNSDNALLYYGDYVRICKILDEPYSNISEDFKSVVRKYYVQGNAGLLNRRPIGSTAEAFDDYVGILSAAASISPEIAFEIFNYGKQNNWCFNNLNPGSIIFKVLNPKFYFGRIFGFIAHAYFANKLKPSFFEQLRWIAALLMDAYKKDGTSQTRLCWHFVKTYEDSNLNLTLCNLTVKIWKKSFWKAFPEGMGQLFKEYFNKDHPFAVYMEGKL